MEFIYDTDDNDWRAIDDLPDMEEMKLRLQNLMNIFYGESSMDNFEDELEELAVHFGISLPGTKPLITKEKKQ